MGRVTTGSRWTGGPRPSLGTSCSVSTGSPANSVDGQNCRSSGPLPADDVISCKFAIPHLAGHTPQPTPRRFHTPRIPIQAISSHNHNLTMRPPRPASGLRESSANRPTQIPWGAWASASTAASMTTTTGGDAAACMIGPEGPIVVRPEGRTDGTPEGQPASSGAYSRA